MAEMYLDDKGKPVTSIGESAEEAELRAFEEARRAQVRWARMYYDGVQFDARNQVRAKALDTTVDQLAEHEKLHAYSTQIQEAVDFIAQQMAESFALKAEDDPTTEVLMTALKASPDLEGGQDEVEISVTNVLREAMVAQDTPVWIRWDAVKGTAWCDYWASEDVEMRWEPRDKTALKAVITKQNVWVDEKERGYRKRVERSTWKIENGRCVRVVQYDEDDPHETIDEGLPFIPWVSKRAQKKGSKSLRGESLVSTQMMRMADRYNANEQIAYLIARYNSHGNLAVIGDAASLKVELDNRINKDVADILSFPGGTALQILSLPTDPQMIEHQREVLLDGMYGGFGLSRLDHTTLQQMGQVTGYALEIMNRKSDGTFNQVKNRYIGDFRKMLNMILDVTAYKQGTGPDDEQADVETDETSVDLVDGDDKALTMFPKRKFSISLGSGGVIDEVQIRDDFTAGLISRGEALRRRGADQPTVDKIDEEIKKEAPPAPETGLAAKTIGAAASAIKSGSQAASAGTRGK
jgi:hypothetical protein